MCGILWAVLNDSDNRKEDIVIQQFNKLQHRGPDATCHKVIQNKHFLGNHRLAIINTEPSGNQPFELHAKYLVCNGQFYNYTDLGIDPKCLRSDVDVILHLFNSKLHILDVLQKLDGDFAFVLVDAESDTVYIARDPVGVRPLFYGVDGSNEIVCVASEVKAIIDMPGVVKCNVFPPGNVYNTTTKEFTKYTSIYPNASDMYECSYDEAATKVHQVIKKAVEKRISNSDRPIAFLCSGGIDSSIVLMLAYSILKEQGREKDIHMFSMEYDYPGSRSDDSFYASMLASMLGVKHTIAKFTWNDVATNIESIIEQIESYDPNTIRASIPMYFLAKHIRENTDFKVILSGEGADEIFMGYNIFRDVKDTQAANDETQRLIRNIHSFDVLRADRTFAAHGLELRVPFLDKDVLYEVFRIPGEHKTFKHGTEKKLLRDAFQIYNELQATRILQREKERFSDGCGFGYVPSLLNHWISHDATLPRDLATKQRAEKAEYLRIFKKKYDGSEHLIIPRENPSWCTPAVEKQQLVSF